MRIAVYFILLVLGIVAPVALGLVAGLMGPPPYIVTNAPDPAYAEGVEFEDGVRVVALDSSNPGATLSQRLSATPIGSQTRVLDTVRYTRSDNGRAGLGTIVGTLVIQIEGETQADVDARIAALDFIAENPQRNPVFEAFTTHLPITLAALAIYVVLYMLFIFRGAAWAARIEPEPVAPADEASFRQRILALNTHNLPFAIAEDKKGRLVAEWRIADSQWAGPLHAGGLKKTHRIYLEPDPKAKKVRVVETSLDIDWQSTLGVAKGGLRFFQGINFFGYSRGQATGVVFDNMGNWTIAETYNYRFSLSEMKNPLIEVVTKSGWAFSPVITFFRPLGG